MALLVTAHTSEEMCQGVTMHHASAQEEDPAPDMMSGYSARPTELLSGSDRIRASASARGAAKTTELREEPAQRASDARPAMLRRLPAVAVLPAPRSHLEEFFGGQSTKPRETEASPRTCCLGHSLFEAELPYDTRSDAKLEAVLDMLTSCREGARRWVTGSLPAHIVVRHI